MLKLIHFCDWLSETAVSQLIQNVAWIVPATQTIHILALAAVLFSMVIFDLQVIGLLAKPATPDWMRLPMRWMWGGLIVLAVTGTILVLGEPKRELLSWPFRIKLLLLLIVVCLTTLLARVRPRPAHSMGMRVVAVLTLLGWVMIAVCGRWIAYINFGPEQDA